MKLSKSKKILIVGLGLIGGSYAMALKKKGYFVSAITKDQSSIDFALKNNIIDQGYTEVTKNNVGSADIIIFALYPTVFIDWIKEYRELIKKGTVITDVTGVKGCIVYEIQELLGDTAEFISAHPMAGREMSGVQNSDGVNFSDANYIVVPTDKNSHKAIELCCELGETLGFKQIAELSVESHDKMIAFTSQLAHIVSNAYVKSPTAKNHKGLSAGSYRDLTRVAWLNPDMWTELFLENRAPLIEELTGLLENLTAYRDALVQKDGAALWQLLEDGRRIKGEIDG